MTFGEDTDFLSRAMYMINSAWITSYCGYYWNNREGNVVSDSLNRRYIELLCNSKIIYDTLHTCPDSTIGVHRINVVVNQVLEKVPLQEFNSERYRIYLKFCKEVARYPQKIDVLAF